MKNENQKQQGDVTLQKLDKFPEGPRKMVPCGLRGIVLAEGEQTGHAHTISVEDLTKSEAQLIMVGERMLLKLETAVVVEHQEHKPVVLEPGIWDVGRVRTIDHLTGMVSRVQD